MKEFNLEVEWNAAEGRYDYALQIKGHTMNEIIESMANVIVHAFDDIYEDKYESAVASTATAFLIGRKLDEIYGDVFTLEQKQDIQYNANSIDETIGGKNNVKF